MTSCIRASQLKTPPSGWVPTHSSDAEHSKDIKQWRTERGHAIPIYIQDRTLIEDTESSIDLVRAGWKLYNYPERLAYSATPPDFGSLLIQRRRWANGGLLILQTLLAYAWHAPKCLKLARELVLRTHYLASLSGGSAATLLLFFYPFDDAFAIVWVPLSALPYFLLCARDLRQAGYRHVDVLRVYALNLVLLPVILGGVLKSLQQGITGAKIPFGRTPKVATRSATPPLYAVVQLALPLMFFAAFAQDALAGRSSHALYTLVNGALFAYALVWLIGAGNTVTDAVSWWSSRTPVGTWFPVNPAVASPAWFSTLRVGIGVDAATASDDAIAAGRS